MPNSGDPLRGGEPEAWRAAHPPECPNRPWGYGARPVHRPAGAGHAASRGFQLLMAATAGAAAYAFYHKVYGYKHCDKPHHPPCDQPHHPPGPHDQHK